MACVTSSQEALVKSAGKKGNEQEDIAKGPPIKYVDILRGEGAHWPQNFNRDSSKKHGGGGCHKIGEKIRCLLWMAPIP